MYNLNIHYQRIFKHSTFQHPPNPIVWFHRSLYSGAIAQKVGNLYPWLMLAARTLTLLQPLPCTMVLSQHLIIHFLTSEGVSEWAGKQKSKWSKQYGASEWVSGASKWANGRVSDPVPVSGFLVVLALGATGTWECAKRLAHAAPKAMNRGHLHLSVISHWSSARKS